MSWLDEAMAINAKNKAKEDETDKDLLLLETEEDIKALTKICISI